MIQKHAFNKIYEMFSEDIKKYARRFVKNQDIIEDICQEVFDVFYKKMDRIDCTDFQRVRAWLLIAVSFKVKDSVRNSLRDKKLAEKVMGQEEVYTPLIEADFSPEDILLRKESILLRKSILQEFKKLYPDDFEMLVRKECYNDSSEEIARDYHITVNNFYLRIHRFKCKLRAELKSRMQEN